MPTSANSPLVNRGPKWQVVQLPLPTKIASPALREQRIARHRLLVAAHERVAEVVECRSRACQRLVVRRECLADVDRDGFVVCRSVRVRTLSDSRSQRRIVANAGSDMRDVGAHLARIEQRPDALRPQAVVRAVPAVPAMKPDVEHASAYCDRPRSRPKARARAVLERAHGRDGRWRTAPSRCPRAAARRTAARRARSPRACRTRDCADRRARRRPRSVRRDARDLVVAERHRRRLRERELRERGTKRGRRSSLQLDGRGDALGRAAVTTSNAISQRPGMWNIRPSARQRPGPAVFTVGA